MRNAIQTRISSVCPSAALTSGRSRRIAVLGLVLAAAVASPAQDGQPSPDLVKFKTLVDFDGTTGGNPAGSLVQGTNGNLYGTTDSAGAYNGGTVFRVTPGGSLTVLYNFCAQPNCPDGSNPTFLVLSTDGNFYGVTYFGGANASPFGGGAGTVFKITPDGALTTLYSFCAQPNCADGLGPAGIVQGTDGSFYGTTTNGGNSTQNGVLFKITSGGIFTVLYSFCAQTNCTDGGSPAAALIQATDGNFYGTTQLFGSNGGGTIFKITPKGALTTVYSFCALMNCSDGGQPEGSLVQAANGDFYGTTNNYGACATGNCGTVFEITPAGALTTLYNFCAQANCADGTAPQTGLVLATDGNFYGTTAAGGTNQLCAFGTQGCGTVFKITPAGALTTLHDFNGTDGSSPMGMGLAQDTNGAFYGTTWLGATNDPNCFSGCGTLFSLAVGLGPFVETLPTSGKVGARVKILGSDLTGATSVDFNGTPAVFTVKSKTQISATVPAGATTGFVTVTGPAATLKSNTKFRVRP